MTLKRSIVLTTAVLVVGASLSLAVRSASADDKADIQALEKRIEDGLKARDAKAIMANYLPGNDLIVFDVIPPRQYKGWDAYKKDFEGFLAGCADTPTVEFTDVTIETAGKIAWGHSIQRIACTDPKGGKMDLTSRVTDVYRKVKGKWLIVHEHVSVPVDLATGKADLSSKP